MHSKGFLWIIVLALLWAPGALLVKIAVHDIPPLTLAGIRVSVAAALLYVVLRMQRQQLPPLGDVWKHFAVMGLTSNALPYALVSWSEQYIDSALASIFVGTTPIFTIVLAHLFIADERLTAKKATGVLIGFGGLVALLIPSLLGGVQTTLWGLLAMVIMAASTGVAMVYGRQHLRGLPSLVGPTAQLMLAAVYLMPLAWVIERPYALPMPSWTAISALLVLAVVCTALTFVLYYRAMERTSASGLSMITYLIPIMGTILGMLVLHEQPGWNAYLGCVLIITGAMIVNEIIRPIGWRQASASVARS